MLASMLDNLRNTNPIIHNITNYVTANDCANALLAVGASPLMSDEAEECYDISKIASALNINIGTLNKNTIKAMFIAGEASNRLAHPVLLDPVGVGASSLRLSTVKELLSKIKFTVIRGNISEIKTIAVGGSTNGVDANKSDALENYGLDEVISMAKHLSRTTGAVIVISGAKDIVADSEKAYVVYNGDAIMSRITGSGCMLSAVTTAFIAANSAKTDAALASVCAIGICGQRAAERIRNNAELGNSSFRNMIIDELYNLDGNTLERCAEYEVR